jgi:hypothetical protein
MLDRIADWILAIPNSIPILLGADPHNAALVRMVAALLLIVLVVYLIAARPFRSISARFSSRSREEEKRD